MTTKEKLLEKPSKSIPITRPTFDRSEEVAVVEVLRSGWVVQGPKVAEFERRFAEFTGTSHAIATTSGTTALHLALLQAGIGSGHTVLVPSFTYVATANAVEYTGARVQFVDIDLKNFNLDTARLELALSSGPEPKPSVVVPVSLFGHCAPMDQINRLADYFGLTVIEDAACGFGATRDGHHAGSETLAGCFSFHPRKLISTGEGGMIVTDDDDFAAGLRELRNHGAGTTDLQRHLENGGSLLPDHEKLGYNYRMTDIQGAIGIVQLDKGSKILANRRRAAARYDKLLEPVACLRAPVCEDRYEHACQSYVCLYGLGRLDLHSVEGIDWETVDRLNLERNHLMARLEEEGIAMRQGTHAVHLLGYYRHKYGLKPTDFPMSYLADRLSISLPLFSEITEDEQVRVVDSIQRLSEEL